MGRAYGYYCIAANTIGVVGKRWASLIVRDLLNELKRLTDFLIRLGNITPKWLVHTFHISGISERIKEFMHTFRLRDEMEKAI